MSMIGTIYEMIKYHNELLDEFRNFGSILCDTYSDIDDTPANDKYFEVISKFREEGIFLCCEANQYDNGWLMTEDSYVMTNGFSDEEECNRECQCCNCDEALEHHDPEYITTLKLGKDRDVWVDITDAGDMWEAWMYRENMGVKSYMFGWPKVQHADTDEETYYNLDDFIDLVCGNAREHLDFYDEQYGD